MEILRKPGRLPSLPMGEIAVSQTSGSLRTLLGSCLGLALYEQKLKLGALAHIVLPASLGRTDPPGKFADTAVPAMIGRMRKLVDNRPVRLQAKLAGGANMFAAAGAVNTVGSQNVSAIERILKELGIPVVARHCGGEQGRKMTFDLATGLVTIEIVGAEIITL
ncbi:MAG TPA: chemotaxis protein CheD [Pirellulales bacterium]|nr:chemotaxis protein CheD [Pirellulales bacterium]